MGTARNARCAKPYSARSTAVLMDDARSIQAAARKINSPYDRSLSQETLTEHANERSCTQRSKG